MFNTSNKLSIKKFKILFSLLLIIITTILNSFLVYSQYYADIQIDVLTDGYTQIDGTTNYPAFKNQSTSQYTSKDSKYWTFNLTTNESFSDFVFQITLPSNAQINYIKAPLHFRIETQDENLVVKGFSQDKPVNIIIQYSVEKTIPQNNTFTSQTLIAITISILLLIFLTLYLTNTKKENLNLKPSEDNLHQKLPLQHKENSQNKTQNPKTSSQTNIDLELFTPRQQDIIKLLTKNKGKLTQKEIEQKMQIPKSSISRNIRTLEIKGIIKKEKVAQTNYIILIQ